MPCDLPRFARSRIAKCTANRHRMTKDASMTDRGQPARSRSQEVQRYSTRESEDTASSLATQAIKRPSECFLARVGGSSRAGRRQGGRETDQARHESLLKRRDRGWRRFHSWLDHPKSSRKLYKQPQGGPRADAARPADYSPTQLYHAGLAPESFSFSRAIKATREANGNADVAVVMRLPSRPRFQG